MCTKLSNNVQLAKQLFVVLYGQFGLVNKLFKHYNFLIAILILRSSVIVSGKLNHFLVF